MMPPGVTGDFETDMKALLERSRQDEIHSYLVGGVSGVLMVVGVFLVLMEWVA